MSISGVPSRQSRPTTESGLPSTFDQPHHAHGDRVGPGRRAQGKGAALGAVMAGHLQHQIARRLVHPVEHDEMGAGLHVLEGRRPALIDLEGADGVGFAGVFRAVLARLPRRVDAADEIEPGVGLVRQLDRHFAVADAEFLVVISGSSIKVMPGLVPGIHDAVRLGTYLRKVFAVETHLGLPGQARQ